MDLFETCTKRGPIHVGPILQATWPPWQPTSRRRLWWRLRWRCPQRPRGPGGRQQLPRRQLPPGWSCHRCRRRPERPWKLRPCNRCMWRTWGKMEALINPIPIKNSAICVVPKISKNCVNHPILLLNCGLWGIRRGSNYLGICGDVISMMVISSILSQSPFCWCYPTQSTLGQNMLLLKIASIPHPVGYIPTGTYFVPHCATGIQLATEKGSFQALVKAIETATWSRGERAKLSTSFVGYRYDMISEMGRYREDGERTEGVK